MAIDVGGLVVEIRPAFKTDSGVIHDGAVPVEDNHYLDTIAGSHHTTGGCAGSCFSS